MAQPLFVVGVGRSGTTVLTRVLSAHGEIVLGIERFKYAWRPGHAHLLGPQLLERQRFFDFSDGLTNILPSAGPQWERHYGAMAEKFDRARYVGDKTGTVRIRHLLRCFPDAKVVCIVRDPFAVAHSWEQRARNPLDEGWPSSRTALAAIDRWNDTLSRVDAALRRSPQQVCAVEHDEFFRGPGPLGSVLDFLDLPWDDSVRGAHGAASQEYVSGIAAKDRRLPEAVGREVEVRAEWTLWGTVRAACRR